MTDWGRFCTACAGTGQFDGTGCMVCFGTGYIWWRLHYEDEGGEA